MHARTAFTLILLVGLFACAADCCPNNCNGLGKCTASGKCICPNGWYGEDCSENLFHVRRATMIAYQVFSGIFFGAATILSIAIFIVRRRKQLSSTLSLGLDKTQYIILGLITYLVIANFLILVPDPFLMLKVMPYACFRFFFASIFPGLVTLWSVVVVHWAKIYDHSVALLRKNEMLSKINSNYKGEVTVEEVIASAKANRTKIFYFLFGWNIIMWILNFLRELLLGMKIVTQKTPGMQITWLVFIAVSFIGQSVAVFFFSNRLISVLPQDPRILLKLVRFTTIMRVMSVFLALAGIILCATMGAPKPTPDGFIAGDWFSV